MDGFGMLVREGEMVGGVLGDGRVVMVVGRD